MTERDDDIITGSGLVTGREKANAATKLKLTLMRRRGFDAKTAGEIALHELTHANAVKGKPVSIGTKRGKGYEHSYVQPDVPLTAREHLKMNAAVGPRMSSIDKANVRTAKVLIFLEDIFSLFKRRK